MARVNPAQFIQQVRAETSKVVWPTRREVMLTSVMVFFLAILTAIARPLMPEWAVVRPDDAGAFPLAIWLGASAKDGPVEAKISHWLGWLSYPVYVLQLPVPSVQPVRL